MIGMAFLELFKKNRVGKKSNYEIGNYWEKRKMFLRISFVIIVSFLLLIGFELSTPNYSFTTLISEKLVNNSETLRSILESDIPIKILNKYFNANNDISKVVGSGIKVSIFLTILITVALHIIISDYLGNSELLHNLSLADNAFKPPFIVKWMSEIYYYAKNAPSNRLVERCLQGTQIGCDNIACSNRLTPTGLEKIERWKAMMGDLSPDMLNSLLASVQKCRCIFYIRYGLWFSAAILVPVYFVARIVEWQLELPFDANYSLIYYVISLWLMGVIIGQFNNADAENKRGVWGSFKESVFGFISSADYERIFDQKVCKHRGLNFSYYHNNRTQDIPKQTKSSGWEIQTLMTLSDYLDNIVNKKMVSHIYNKGKDAKADVQYLNNLLEALIEMYGLIYNNQCKFRASLLVPNSEDTHLIPLSKAPFPDRPFVTIQTDDEYKARFSRMSGSIASQTWAACKTHSRTGTEIPFFHDTQAEYLKSIMALPLIISDDVKKAADDTGLKVDSILGILCVDCDSEDVFSMQKERFNEVLVRPYGTRLVYEILSNYVKLQTINKPEGHA